jgi:hypothetical protein
VDEIIAILKQLEATLVRIEGRLAVPTLHASLEKQIYSCAEVAQLTAEFGSRKYAAFTVRLQ